MKECRISDHWSFHGLRTVILENGLVKVTLLVVLGARLHEFVFVGALEAWSGYPSRLHEAVDHGVYTRLPAHATLECETALVAYEGVTGVSGVAMDRSITAAE